MNLIAERGHSPSLLICTKPLFQQGLIIIIVHCHQRSPMIGKKCQG